MEEADSTVLWRLTPPVCGVRLAPTIMAHGPDYHGHMAPTIMAHGPDYHGSWYS